MSASSAPYLLSIQHKNATNPQSKKPDFPISLLQLSKNVKELLQLHALLIKTSLIKEKRAFGRLLSSFTSFDDVNTLDYARKLFDTAEISRNSFMYNIMIRAYTNRGNPREAFVVYSGMMSEVEEGVVPDDYTFTFVFSACSRFGGVFEGKQAHAQMIKCACFPRFGTHSRNSLMDFYVKIGEMGDVISLLFDEIENPDIVSWNCLVDGYVKSGDLDEARRVFDEMPQRDVVSWTILLVGYINAGLLDEASCFFNDMPQRNLVSWTALINGYVQNGLYEKALDLFKEMQKTKIEMDAITITSLLSACAGLGALDQGRWLHTYVDKHGTRVDPHLSTALIDMYSKCGQIDLAWKVFRETVDKKVFVWNSMLGGLAMHSFGEEACELFTEMKECGIQPNEISYINILAACNHCGLVDVGLQIFNKMVNDEKIQPTIEHYGCLVDLLGRAGLLHEAFSIAQSMPTKADGNVWRALLGACKMHGNVELGQQVGKILIEMEPRNEMNYVLLSNVYAGSHRWESAGKLRREMKVKGLRKTPGCSLIELNGLVHEFASRDNSHPQTVEIYTLLRRLAGHMVQDRLEIVL